MQQDDLKTIQLTIAGRIFPLKVNKAEERIAHEVEIELNAKISDFQNLYTTRDKLDCVIMALLTYVFDQKKSIGTEDKSLKVVESKVDTIQKILESIQN